MPHSSEKNDVFTHAGAESIGKGAAETEKTDAAETEGEKINAEAPAGKKKRAVVGPLFSLLFFLFFRIESWLCSIPAWATLILHFAVGLPIWWFWGTLAVWLAVGIIRYAVISFAVRCGNSPQPVKENKNPYSKK